MVNYQNGKIYKLVNNIDDEIYVGSTCNPLRVRKGLHKSDAKTQSNRNIYIHLNHVGWENVEIILIENFECNSKDELHKRERYWIDTLKPSLNKRIPSRTLKEYRQENKVVLAQKHKEWYQENKEVIIQKQKEFYQENKEVILQQQKEFYQENKESLAQKAKEFYQANKQQINEKNKKYHQKNKEVIIQKQKEYYQENKEVIIQHQKEYYQKNKEVILQQTAQKNKIKFTCVCGSTLRKSDNSQHKKTKKHLFWEKQYNYIYS